MAKTNFITALRDTFQQALANRAARKSEPTTALPIIQQRVASPIPDMYFTYAGHEHSIVNVMSRRLAEAKVEELTLGESVSPAALEDILNPKFLARGSSYEDKMLARAFEQAANGTTLDIFSTLRKVTLGPDPYGGKDYYPGANAISGGQTSGVFLSALSVDELNTLIESAKQATQAPVISAAPVATPEL